jgi:butyrate kinase
MVVFVINPGSTSTKLGLATVVETPRGVSAFVEKVELQHPTLSPRPNSRALLATSIDGTAPLAPVGLDAAALEVIRAQINVLSDVWPRPDAIAARGGLIGPVAAGTYTVTPELAAYSESGKHGVHSANYGAGLALEWCQRLGGNVPAFIVDPPTVDELLPEARVSGVPGIRRRSRFHALNARAVARRAALEVGKRFEEATIVVAHLGGGVSITAFERGIAADTTGALLDEGPFSPQRAGTVPLEGILDLAYTLPREVVVQQLTRESGFQGLVGTSDLQRLEAREDEDSVIGLAIRAYIHQVAKSIGAYSTVGSRPHAIAITGGTARWVKVVQRLEQKVGWIAPVIVVPGELELEALAEGAGRVLLGLEPALEFKPG